jgi:hypothetical protein
VMIGERQAVRDLGEAIGYGRLMQLAEELWREKLVPEGIQGGELTVGPCASMMVPCAHSVRDSSGYCEICCWTGRVTKWVAAHV